VSDLKIAVVGAGYVGLVTSVCLSNLGFSVTCTDTNNHILEALGQNKVPFFEPGLTELLVENVSKGRLLFTASLSQAVLQADIVFVAVGTPAGDVGQADLSCVHAVIDALAPHLREGAVLVIKSTVPVGTNRILSEKLTALCPATVHVVSNPEFLREGAAIEDFLHPDRIVMGCESSHAQEVMTRLYAFFINASVPVVFCNWETAELIKYASNSFLALKIGFANEISDLCERVGASMPQISQGMGLDPRIGADFLRPGPGYGGSCFPKDTQALVYGAALNGIDLSLVRTLIQSNDERKKKMVTKIIEACGGSVANKTIGILGITFKAQTDDVRESPSLFILPALQEKGARLKVYDPQGMKNGQKLFENVHWCSHAWEVAEGSDGVVILTEWAQFRDLDLGVLKNNLRSPVLIDLRNLMDPETVRMAGLGYVGVGYG
jgi:UDPglucose 6-dehydrogenase